MDSTTISWQLHMHSWDGHNYHHPMQPSIKKIIEKNDVIQWFFGNQNKEHWLCSKENVPQLSQSPPAFNTRNQRICCASTSKEDQNSLSLSLSLFSCGTGKCHLSQISWHIRTIKFSIPSPKLGQKSEY